MSKKKDKKGGEENLDFEKRIPKVGDIELLEFIPSSREELRRKNYDAKLRELFEMFEYAPGMVDVREVGTIVRAMGLNPSENDVFLMIQAIQEPEAEGCVQMEKLQQLVVDILITKQFQGRPMVRDSEAQIHKAFSVLDRDKKGFVESSYIRELMTNMGEKFSPDEILEFLNASEDDAGRVYYDDMASVLATE